MFLFSLVIFPCFFLYYRFLLKTLPNNSHSAQQGWLVSIFGFIAGCLAAGVCAFFTFPRAFTQSNVVAGFFYEWVRFVFLPFVFYIIILFWSVDSLKFRVDVFLSFMLPFYTVWFPFETFRTAETPSFFVLFIRPLLYLCMIVTVSFEINTLYQKILLKHKKNIVISLFYLVFEMTFPALIGTVWYFGFFSFVWWLCFVLYGMVCLYRNRYYFFTNDVDKEIEHIFHVIKNRLIRFFDFKKKNK